MATRRTPAPKRYVVVVGRSTSNPKSIGAKPVASPAAGRALLKQLPGTMTSDGTVWVALVDRTDQQVVAFWHGGLFGLSEQPRVPKNVEAAAVRRAAEAT